MDANKRSANVDHTIFKDPFVQHDKGKASSLGIYNNTENYTNVAYDYAINIISAGDEIMATITVNPRNQDCAIITR